MIVGVVGNPGYEGLGGLLGRLLTAAPQHDIDLRTEAALEQLWPEAVPVFDLDREPPDIIVCFGGDGTMLRAFRTIDRREIPMLGVKIGRVGFLAGATPERLDEALADIGAGRYELDRRRMLEAAIVAPDGAGEPAVPIMNDVVVHKSGVARLIRLQVVQDHEEIGAFSSDGLIVATPTGSTAYSLSAGGPIVVPGVDALVVTPISPHTLAVRPIVVPGQARITVTALPPRGEGDVLVSYDGQVGHVLEPDHQVVVTRSANVASLVRLTSEGFFSLMRRKLQWGDLTDRERQ